jgi:hypothetical protein
MQVNGEVKWNPQLAAEAATSTGASAIEWKEKHYRSDESTIENHDE